MTLPAAEQLLAFTRALRARGWPIGLQEQQDVLRVAEQTGLEDPRRLARALRPLCCGTREQWHGFEALFEQWWRPRRGVRSRALGPGGGLRPAPGRAGGEEAAPQPDRPAAGNAGDADPAGARAGASPQAGLGRTDFRHLCDPEESRALDALMDRMARRWQRRVRRRWRALQKGRRLAPRATLRRSLARGGVPFDPVWRRPRRQPPRLILLVDASRSMNLYSYRFLRFAGSALQAFPRSEAFIFHTELVRITDALQEARPERLREKLALLSTGWSGGTRIGACLARFNRQYGEGVRRRSVVLIFSDGLDTGDPETLTRVLAELRGRAGRLLWLNPLMGRSGYAPEARGMRSALPYLDRLAPAHTLDSLLALEQELIRL
ncbi:vWA domain-containing protein [Alkalilimnicola ehrlichii]|uniref:vWA domain-containing protein n=1 Tax=Alkalilimnicola ehrlichii TaxID=351052 RepID=UPI003BA198CE